MADVAQNFITEHVMRYKNSMMWAGAIALSAVLLGAGSAYAGHGYDRRNTSVGGHVVVSTGQVSVVLGGQYNRPAPRVVQRVYRPAPVVVYRPAPVCRPVYVKPRCAPPRPVVIHHRYDRHRRGHDKHWGHNRGRGHDKHWNRGRGHGNDRHDRGDRGDRGRRHR